MYLVRLIYVSRVNTAFSAADAQQILTASTHHNVPLGLTGLLCCDGRYFMQCLEGSRESVNARFAKIIADPRHRDILLLSYGEISCRQFAQWAMGYVALASHEECAAEHDVVLHLHESDKPPETQKPHAICLAMNRTLLLKYSTKPEFDPYQLGEESALGLLVELGNKLASACVR